MQQLVTEQTIDYTYDPLNRLTGANYDDGSSYAYTYDAVGNRLTENAKDETNQYTYDPTNRLASVNDQAYTYDANGNLLTDGAKTYTYNYTNRLTNVTAGTDEYQYVYNGLGDRLQSILNGTATTYSLDLHSGLTQVLADGTNTYTYGFNRIAQVSETQTGYFFGDALGSVRQVVNPQAEVLQAQSYSPYGEVLSSVGEYKTAYSYTGEMTDGTGLVNLRARYYDPGTGRFVSRDTWAGNNERPLSLNKWTFVEGNPIVRTDPSGHCYGLLQFLRNVPVEREICNSLDQAMVIYVWPGSSPAELTLASAYIGGWAFGHSVLIVGAAGLSIAGAKELSLWIITQYQLNPIFQREANKICERSKIWSLKPLQRDNEIDNILGRSPFLVNNFPVIDRWENGIATSFKSIDLN